MSILKWQVNSSSICVAIFIVITHNSSVDFNFIHFLLWTKGSHETFECSGENLPVFSCYFPNRKSVLVQTLHHSSVSWKIIHLYFFKYFAQYESIKVEIFETLACSGQNAPKSCHFWNNKSIFLQILHRSSVSRDITSLYFFSWNFIYFQ